MLPKKLFEHSAYNVCAEILLFIHLLGTITGKIGQSFRDVSCKKNI